MPISERPGPSSRRARAFAEIATLLRYGVVGLTNTAIYLVLSGILLAVGTAPALASVAGYAAGAVFSFITNQGWTFRVASSRPHAFARFCVVQIVSVTVLTVGALLLSRMTGAGPLLAECCVLPPVVGTAYIVNRNWVFGAGPARGAVSPSPPDPAPEVR